MPSAIVGAAGLLPTLTAIRAGQDVGLANKEALVMAGSIVMAEAKRNGIRITPVESEHSAVYQCMEGRKKEEVRRIVLTASGGPFVNRAKAELDDITAEDALKHPNWSMGRKISIDSATLMNKGLEVIEACWLFGLSPDYVDVLIHPQSIVHSMVEFRDRTFLAQMSMPDMRAPIAYALSYPDRLHLPLQSLELDRIGQLTLKPDYNSFVVHGMIAEMVSHCRDRLFQEVPTCTVLSAARIDEEDGAKPVSVQLGDDLCRMGLQPVVESEAHGSVVVMVPRGDPGLTAGIQPPAWSGKAAQRRQREVFVLDRCS